MRTPFRVERIDKSGFRNLSIVDGGGHAVCNLVFRLDDREVEVAHAICAAVNRAFPAPAARILIERGCAKKSEHAEAR